MTNELEKTFFDTFGIGAYYKYLLIDKTSRYNNEKLFDKTNFIDFVKSGKDYLLLKVIKYYPQITDRILLELICIDFNENPYKCRGGQTSVDEVKERILSDFIHEFENDLYLDKENIKYQVRTLFEEG